MAFTLLADAITALPGQVFDLNKFTSVGASGAWASAWGSAGSPAAGANPSSGLAGDVPTSATLGALPFVDPASGGTCLGRAQLSNALANGTCLLLYDRLWQNSGVSSTSTAGQTVNSVALTRPDALGANVELWWQVYGAMGAGTPTVTIAYTNQAGTAGQSATSGALATTLAAGRTGPFQIASGDTGVRSVQTWTASATFTSGTIGLVLRRLIAVLPVPLVGPPMGEAGAEDIIGSGLGAIPNGACLELVAMTGTTVMQLMGQLQLIQG